MKELWTERHTEYYASLIWLNDSDDSGTVRWCDRTGGFCGERGLKFRRWNVSPGAAFFPSAKYKQNALEWTAMHEYEQYR